MSVERIEALVDNIRNLKLLLGHSLNDVRVGLFFDVEANTRFDADWRPRVIFPDFLGDPYRDHIRADLKKRIVDIEEEVNAMCAGRYEC